MTKPLSPAAQVVETAVLRVASAPGFERRRIIAAAALRAVAASKPWAGHAYGKTLWHVGWDAAMDHVKAIATELEGQTELTAPILLVSYTVDYRND